MNPELPPKVGEIIDRALEKDRKLRYQTASDLRADLQRLKRDTESGRAPATVEARRPVPRQRWYRWALGAFGALAILAVGFVGLNLGGLRDRLFRRAAPAIQSLAVLPLTNLSGDPAQEYFADGMTEELITDLSHIGALKVISRTSVMRYKKSDKSLPQIARELNVDAIVEGSVQRSGDRVRVSAQLVHGATDQHIWASSYERDARDVLALESDVARAIAGEVRIRLTPQETARLTKARPVNLKALDAYLEGRYHLDKSFPLEWHKGLEKSYEEETQKAVASFEQAIREDPNYVTAYLGIFEVVRAAGVVPHLEFVPRAKAAVRKAVELDDSLVRAHSAMAQMLMQYDWNWSGAEKELKRQSKDDQATYFPKGELVYAPSKFDGKFNPADYRLAWSFKIYPDQSDVKAKNVYIDALTGKVIHSVDISMTCSGGTGTSAFNGSVSISTEFTGGVYRSHNNCQATDIYVYNCNGGAASNLQGAIALARSPPCCLRA